jgi:hypothetical protein
MTTTDRDNAGRRYAADVDFLIIGAYKCGTTSLYQALSGHPHIDMASIQEPNFFARPPEPGPELARFTEAGGYRRPRTFSVQEYEALFLPRRPDLLRGDCSPEYMRNPLAPPRIAAALPDVRLVAILRNPIDRALSDYSMFVRDGLEKAPFSEAIRRSQSDTLLHHYVYTGFYGRQLQRFFDVVPADRIRVILLEDVVADRTVLSNLLLWLGADDPDSELGWSVHNRSGRPRNRAVATAYSLRRRGRRVLKPIVPTGVQRRVDAVLASQLQRLTMTPHDRAYLAEIYADDVSLLSGLTGRDLQHWITP